MMSFIIYFSSVELPRANTPVANKHHVKMRINDFTGQSVNLIPFSLI